MKSIITALVFAIGTLTVAAAASMNTPTSVG